MGITMKFSTYLVKAAGRWKYEGNIEVSLGSEIYIVVIEAITNPTPPKSAAYIKLIMKKSTGRVSNNKAVLSGINRCLYKLFLAIDKSVESIVKEKQKLSSQSWEDFLQASTMHLQPFKVDDSISVLNFNLSDEDIDKISLAKKTSSKLVVSATLSRLKQFLADWEPLVAASEVEQRYQDLLFKYKDLFPILFGVTQKCKKEYKLTEGSVNKCDIYGEGWIIELKKPATKLFTTKNSRNNVSGISSEFISADNQLELYVRKANRERDLLQSFTKGILIIGSNSQMLGDEHKMALEIMREKSKYTILTFDDVTEIIKKKIDDFK